MNNNENNNKVTEKNVLTKQLSIQPNIPAHLVLARTNSRRITSQKSVPTFPTKTLRMKSLLWTKPTGIAINSLPSTLKQVSHYWYLRSISYQSFQRESILNLNPLYLINFMGNDFLTDICIFPPKYCNYFQMGNMPKTEHSHIVLQKLFLLPLECYLVRLQCNKS